MDCWRVTYRCEDFCAVVAEFAMALEIDFGDLSSSQGRTAAA